MSAVGATGTGQAATQVGFAVHDIRGMPLLGMTVVVSDPYQPDLVRVSLTGELSPSTAAELERLFDGLIASRIVLRLNLCDLSLCTSHGIELFERTRDQLEALGGSLELVGAHGDVRRVLEITGFPATTRPA